jgi:protein SCO1/2
MNHRANRTQLLAALVVAGLLALTVAGCGGGGGEASAGSQQGGSEGQATTKASYQGAEATPPKAAPELKLDNSFGEPVDLAALKGKAVLVTFIYTHCPDVCPLIVSHLKTAQAELGAKADDLEIIAVSTDPKGDTPTAVKLFLAQHGMVGKMQYLTGSRSELEKVWSHWNIVAKPEKANPDFVEHSALIYGIAADGKVTTLYSSNFKPSEVAHDVPLLEQQ